MPTGQDLQRPREQGLAHLVKGEAPLLVLAVVCLLIASVIGRANPAATERTWQALAQAVLTYLSVLPAPLPILFLVERLGVRGPSGAFLPGAEGWLLAWTRFRKEYLSRQRVVTSLLAVFALSLVFGSYAVLKKSIPALNGYRWDRSLADMDRMLHLGSEPWRVLQPLFGHPALTRLLDEFYVLWVSVLVLALTWQAWSGNRVLRLQFFLSVAGVWVLGGSLLGTLLSSAGPAYYSRLVPGPDPFQGLMVYLNEIHTSTGLAAVAGQEMLWRGFVEGRLAMYDGISAMPSVHVGMATLLVFLGYEYGRWLGTPALLFFITTLVGSVHLGWHYAVDGYAATLTAVVVWIAAGRLSRLALTK